MMDKAKVGELRKKLQETLDGVFGEFGLTGSIKGTAVFTDHNVIFKVELSEVGSDGVVETPERTAFKMLCGDYGLRKEDLDKPFTYGKKTYSIVGLATRSWKNPIVLESSKGRRYNAPVEAVRLALGSL